MQTGKGPSRLNRMYYTLLRMEGDHGVQGIKSILRNIESEYGPETCHQGL